MCKKIFGIGILVYKNKILNLDINSLILNYKLDIIDDTTLKVRLILINT